MARVLDVKTIKSAKRVLQVFEYFDSSRREATVMEIAREYGYPQSSTSELLSCLVELGFLHRDRYRRTYRPTAKVAVLGAWTNPGLFRRGGVLAMMDELSSDLECSVVLAGRVGLNVEHLEYVHGGTELSEDEQPGAITTTTIGRLLLSVNDRFVIRKRVHHINSEVAEDRRVKVEDLFVEVDQMRKHGFAISAGVSQGKGGVVATLLPRDGDRDELAIGLVVGEGDLRGAAFFMNALRDAIAAHVQSDRRATNDRHARHVPPPPAMVPAMVQAG
jgi:DNA-binding IclR family transcriptional regulator